MLRSVVQYAFMTCKSNMFYSLTLNKGLFGFFFILQICLFLTFMRTFKSLMSCSANLMSIMTKGLSCIQVQNVFILNDS